MANNKKRILHINCKAQWFHETKSGEKKFEFRRMTPHWKSRLVGREYDEVHIKLGYPKRDDDSRIVRRPWRGYEIQTITHEHFGNVSTGLFAIRVN